MKSPTPLILLACMATCRTALPASAVETTFERLVSVCGEIPDAQARVACFDREIAPFRARAKPVAPATRSAAPPTAPATSAAPAASIAPAPPTPAAKDLGAEQVPARAGRPERPDESLTARITAIRSLDVDASLVTLDNGQVWRNEDSRRSSYLREGASVTIRKGSFGSYRMTLDGGDSRNWISVTRVR